MGLLSHIACPCPLLTSGPTWGLVPGRRPHPLQVRPACLSIFCSTAFSYACKINDNAGVWRKGPIFFPRLILSTCFESWFMCNVDVYCILSQRGHVTYFLSSVVFPQKKIMIFSSSLISPFHIFPLLQLPFVWTTRQRGLWSCPMGAALADEQRLCLFMGWTLPGTLTLLPFLRDSQEWYFTSDGALSWCQQTWFFTFLSKIKSSELVLSKLHF